MIFWERLHTFLNQRWVRMLFSGVLIAVMVGMLYNLEYPFAQLPQMWAATDKILVIIAALLVIPNILLDVFKWFIFIRIYYKAFPFWVAIRAVLLGHALGFVTPQRLGEFAGRAGLLPAGYRVEAVTLTVLDRLIQLAATVTFGVPVVLYYANTLFKSYLQPQYYYAAILLVIIIVGGAGLLLFKKSKLLLLTRIQDTIRYAPIHLVLINYGLSLVRYGIFALQYMLLIQAFGSTSEVTVLLSLIAIVYLFKSVLPSVAFTELGIRESVALWVALLMGLPTTPVFNATFTLYLINILMPALLGAIGLVKVKK